MVTPGVYRVACALIYCSVLVVLLAVFGLVADFATPAARSRALLVVVVTAANLAWLGWHAFGFEHRGLLRGLRAKHGIGCTRLHRRLRGNRLSGHRLSGHRFGGHRLHRWLSGLLHHRLSGHLHNFGSVRMLS